MTVEDMAYKLIEKYQEKVNNGEFSELPKQKELVMALSILVDARQNRFQDLVADVFRFGMYVVKHKEDVDDIEQEMTEDEEMEKVKRCLSCDKLVPNKYPLRCRLEKCIYD